MSLLKDREETGWTEQDSSFRKPKIKQKVQKGPFTTCITSNMQAEVQMGKRKKGLQGKGIRKEQICVGEQQEQDCSLCMSSQLGHLCNSNTAEPVTDSLVHSNVASEQARCHFFFRNPPKPLRRWGWKQAPHHVAPVRAWVWLGLVGHGWEGRGVVLLRAIHTKTQGPGPAVLICIECFSEREIHLVGWVLSLKKVFRHSVWFTGLPQPEF